MHIVVTGANGFIGRHVRSILEHEHTHSVSCLTRESMPGDVERELAQADAVIHAAGVNRPQYAAEFEIGNVGYTERIVAGLRKAGKGATLVLTSTSRAEEDSLYGRTKRQAEELVAAYGRETGASTAIFRLPNVFGKWSRPNYNSAIATFCHAIARQLPFDVHDSATELTLVYAEDVARALIASACLPAGQELPTVAPTYRRTLGELVSLLMQFRELRKNPILPDFSDGLVQKLYTTYVSFIPPEALTYSLDQHTDNRGALAELLKSPWFGQVFLSRTLPGVTRGNHFHQTKTEKFIVVEGEALIQIRPIDGAEIENITVSGRDFRVVDIPPGSTHAITNVGEADLVTLFWSSEVFDRNRPDTFAMPVSGV